MDTPETDKAERMAYAGEYMVPTEIARKLERERDEWAALCGQYKQERNDAREMLMQYMFERSGTWVDFLPADKPTP